MFVESMSNDVLSRKDIEEREEKYLAPYAMKSKDSLGRKHPEEEHSYRSIYQRDKDRIIHSTAFRRLEYKTQVFVNHEGDYYRTRLTHTIEVAQISRCVARTLDLNEDLTEAIALAHDLGHTPFGHSGEDALKKLMKDHGGFEHNLHGLRVVDILEKRYPEFPGLNLSWEVRESIAKHKTTYDKPITDEFNPDERPLLEAQIVDKVDSIAYDNHDLDDSLQAGLITEDALQSVDLWKTASEHVRRKFSSASGGLDGNSGHTRAEKPVGRAQTIIFLINKEVTDLIEHTQLRLKKLGIESTQDVRRCKENIVSFSPDLDKKKSDLQVFLFKNVYQHYRVTRMADKAKRFVEELFNAYIGNPGQLPPEYQRWVEISGLYQGVCDYIAGMTDRYAQDEYMKLFYPYERV